MYNPYVCYFCGEPQVRYSGLPARVLELMRDEGGWWTIHSVAAELGAGWKNVARTVHRYKRLFESRPHGSNGSALEYRYVGR